MQVAPGAPLFTVNLRAVVYQNHAENRPEFSLYVPDMEEGRHAHVPSTEILSRRGWPVKPRPERVGPPLLYDPSSIHVKNRPEIALKGQFRGCNKRGSIKDAYHFPSLTIRPTVAKCIPKYSAI